MRSQDTITRFYRRNAEDIRIIRRYVVYPVIAGALALGACIGLYKINQRQREAEIAQAIEIRATNEIEERRYSEFTQLYCERERLKREIEGYERGRDIIRKVIYEWDELRYLVSQERAARKYKKIKTQKIST